MAYCRFRPYCWRTNWAALFAQGYITYGALYFETVCEDPRLS